MRLIDADMLYRGLCDWQYGAFSEKGCETEYAVLESVLDGIQRQPTIDAFPVRKGKWKSFYRGERNWKCVFSYECSACGIGGNEEKTRFCPNCGAKMDEEG